MHHVVAGLENDEVRKPIMYSIEKQGLTNNFLRLQIDIIALIIGRGDVLIRFRSVFVGKSDIH